ncbi:tyrosine-type recombinase/integrase [Flagellimonas sp.]|uniref:tyrosine-type recombinase/integrase n=1 Tax=Flagellimonas sp. TaxID=2058762 RepID=UPI003B517A71
MHILRIKLSSGKYKPVLISDGIPIYLSFKYSVLKLKTRSYKTQYNHLHSIKIVFEYYHQLEVDFPKEVLANDFNKVWDSLDNLIDWVYYYKSRKKNSEKPIISNLTFNSHLSRIKEFVTWCFLNYSLENKKITIRKINGLFNSHKIRIGPSSTYKSISNKDISSILNLIDSNNETNPFIKRNRIRNYVIFLIMMDTGLRMSELLKLTTDDIIRDEQKTYLRILNRNDDIEDSRISQPRLKNLHSQRIIGIGSKTYQILDQYILYTRKRSRSHRYLFTSDRKGSPLSKSTVSSIFSVISQKTDIQLTPHMLRHNFAERMLKYLIETRGIDMERAKDELQLICGWSLNSRMPILYSRNYISKLANNHNIERLKNEESNQNP